MDLMSQVQRTREEVQSYEREHPSVAPVILTNVQTVHDPHVHLEGQGRFSTGVHIDSGPAAGHSTVGDQPAEVRNLRWLIGGAGWEVMDEHSRGRVKNSPGERAGVGTT